MAGVCWFPGPGPIRDRLQESNSLRHLPKRRNYPWKTAGGSCRWYLNHAAQPAQSLFKCARRPPGGFWGRMQDVVCQLVGIGMVPRYVMKANGVQDTVQHGVRHVVILYQLWLLYQLFHLEWNNWYNWYNMFWKNNWHNSKQKT
jgi:hypothetical protein